MEKERSYVFKKCFAHGCAGFRNGGYQPGSVTATASGADPYADSPSATPKPRTAADSWRSKYTARAAAASFAAAPTCASPSAGPGHAVAGATGAGRSERYRSTPAVPGPPIRRGSPGSSFPAGGMVSLNFNRADLVEIIHIIAQQLRLTYTIDPEVKGTVTINSAEPLRSEDLMPIFHQLLRMNGAVAVRTGNLYHITPIKDGKGMARPLAQGREDSFALQLIPVRFFTVAEMKRVLTPFLQPGAEIIDNPRGNFLIVMDTPLNIQRLTEIVDLIDVQVFAGTRMEIYQPKIASAEDYPKR